MAQPPVPAPSGGSPLPDRRLSNEEFEKVIRRAAELQARAAEGGLDDGMTEGELVRIGRELGLSRDHLSRALAEVRGQPQTGDGWMDRMMGEALVQAARTVPGDAGSIRERLENYLEQHEYLIVQRRFADHTRFVRATGIAASLGRATSELSRRRPRLKVDNLNVSVQPLEDAYSYVTIATELRGLRTGATLGGLTAGAGGGGAVAFAFAIAVAPPAALVGLPVLAGAVYGARQMYGHRLRTTRDQMESFLDRLEHGELPVRNRALGRGRSG